MTHDTDSNGLARPRFRFNREISLGHVLQIISLFVFVVGYGVSVEKRLTALEVTQSYTERALAQISRTIGDISRKLDMVRSEP